MEFVTIHDLSRELNIPSRVIRYRLRKLIKKGALKDGADYRREDFKDPQHFEWKINPVSFIRQSGLEPKFADNFVNEVAQEFSAGNKSVNDLSTIVRKSVTASPPPVNETANVANNLANDAADVSLHREMIDVMKEQIRIKDGQITDLSHQLREKHDLYLKLTGTVLTQAEEIKNLMRLTGGKTDMAEIVIKDKGNVNHIADENRHVGNNRVNEAGNKRDSDEISMTA